MLKSFHTILLLTLEGLRSQLVRVWYWATAVLSSRRGRQAKQAKGPLGHGSSGLQPLFLSSTMKGGAIYHGPESPDTSEKGEREGWRWRVCVDDNDQRRWGYGRWWTHLLLLLLLPHSRVRSLLSRQQSQEVRALGCLDVYSSGLTLSPLQQHPAAVMDLYAPGVTALWEWLCPNCWQVHDCWHLGGQWWLSSCGGACSIYSKLFFQKLPTGFNNRKQKQRNVGL